MPWANIVDTQRLPLSLLSRMALRIRFNKQDFTATSTATGSAALAGFHLPVAHGMQSPTLYSSAVAIAVYLPKT